MQDEGASRRRARAGRWGAGPGLSVGFGVQVTVAMLFGPLEAGLIAFAGAFDARWLRGRMGPLHDLSHRSLALSVVATGSASFHVVAPDVDAGLARIVLGYALAVTLMYLAFLAADLVDRMLETGLPARRLLHDMDRVSPYHFPMTFPGLGWFSLPAARLEQVEGVWPVAMVFGLTAYGRWVCIKAWTLKAASRSATGCSTSRRASWPSTCAASGARWPSSRS